MTCFKSDPTKVFFHLASRVGGVIAPLGMASLLLLGYAMPAGATLTTSNLLIQLDGSDTTGGATVTSWNDQAGGDQNFTEGLKAPGLLSNFSMPNGTLHNVVDFNAGTDQLNLGPTPALNGLNGVSWFMVVELDASVNNTFFFSNGDAGSNFDRWNSGIHASPQDITMYARDSGGQRYNDTGTAVTLSTWYLLSNVYDAANGDFFLRVFDEVDLETPVFDVDFLGGTNGALADHTGSTIGARTGAPNGSFDMDGRIAELLVYDVALGDTARDSTEQYLLDKYFIISAVPEPSLLPLWALGACWFGFTWRRHQVTPN
jgi:hypothetical protein